MPLYLPPLPAFEEWTEIASATGNGSGTTLTLSAIPSKYKELMIVGIALAHDSGSNQTGRLQVSADGGSVWSSQAVLFSAFGNTGSGGFTARVLNYAKSGANKLILPSAGGNAITPVRETSVTGVINTARFQFGAGNITAGSIYAFGKV